MANNIVLVQLDVIYMYICLFSWGGGDWGVFGDLTSFLAK